MHKNLHTQVNYAGVRRIFVLGLMTVPHQVRPLKYFDCRCLAVNPEKSWEKWKWFESTGWLFQGEYEKHITRDLKGNKYTGYGFTSFISIYVVDYNMVFIIAWIVVFLSTETDTVDGKCYPNCILRNESIYYMLHSYMCTNFQKYM